MSTSSLEDVSYVTVAEADSFFSGKKEYESWSSLDTSRKSSELAEASRRLDAEFVWKGIPSSLGQILRWPRKDVMDRDGQEIPQNMIPREVKTACLEQAFHQIVSKSTSLGKLQGTGIKSASAGDLSVTFQSAVSVSDLTPRVRTILRGLGHPRSSDPCGTLIRG